MYDLIILGGGPAGASACIYAARKKLKTAIIAGELAGQSSVSETIYNWPGIPEISGYDLSNNFKKHILYYKGPLLDIFEGEKVTEIKKENDIYIIKTDMGKTYTSISILITTGSGRKKLNAENADKYEHKGITYCASCDGPMFGDQDVIVIGGGNAGFETASQLLAYCKSVTLIHKNKEFKADKITVEKMLQNPKFKTITNAEIIKVDGDIFVKNLTYKDKDTNEKYTLEASGIFVEIGQTPNTDFVKELVNLDNFGKIIVDPTNQKSSIDGIWAAGDCSNGKYHQNSIAAGDAVKAVEDIYIWIQNNK
jgi:NADH-dependent peroxiredoxin subunit F